MQKLKSMFDRASTKAAVAAGALVGPAVSFAADDGGTVGLITQAGVTVAAVCTAVLAVHASIKTFKMIRSAF